MRRQSGFTLIEVLVATVLVTAAGFVLTNMFISQNRIYRTQNAELDVTSAVRQSLDDIDNSVRQANRVVASHDVYTTGSEVLVLQVQSVNNSGRLIGGTFDYIIYYLSNGYLMKKIMPDAASSRQAITKSVGGNVTGLTFTYNNADLAQVTEVATSVTASESVTFQTRTFTVDSKARLRNY